MDPMIAAAAVDEVSLVTRNRKHFARVPGVEVVLYEPWSGRCLTIMPPA